MQTDNDTRTNERPVGGGFGRQTETKGRPSVIPLIKRIPVSFEEFMRDETTQVITILEKDTPQ